MKKKQIILQTAGSFNLYEDETRKLDPLFRFPHICRQGISGSSWKNNDQKKILRGSTKQIILD